MSYRSSRRLVLAIVLLGGLLVPSFSVAPGTSLAAPPTGSDDPAQKVADLAHARASGGISPDRLVVVYRAAATPSALAARDRAGAKLLRSDSQGRLEVLRAPAGNAAALAAQLKQQSDVLDAYPDRVVQKAGSTNDPLLSQQWGLSKLNAPTAWNIAQGQSVNVAVLDCGIDTAHPDLTGQVVQEQNFSSAATTNDLCNHGTHVAGIIAALANNATGGAGVAPAAHLINVKVLDDTGSGFFSDVANGIEWAADNGGRVINMSLGAQGACDPATQAAINYAWSKGVVIVAAAGNDGATSADAPANCQNVIGVAATDQNDLAATWSNTGQNVPLAAPGVGILSTVNPDLNNGAQYAQFSGTSMATPFVSGVAALLASTSYGSSNATIRDRLFTTADRIAATGSSWTYGRIDAASAVGASGVATVTPSTTTTATPTPTSSPTPVPGATTPTPSPSPTPGASFPVVAVPQADQGLNVGWAIDDSGNLNFVHSLSSSIATDQQAGAGWVRVVFRLGGCYSNWTSVGCNGETALQAYDQVLANIRANNLRVLGIITAESWPGTQADWTANNAETAGGTGDNPYVQAFAQQAAGVLAQHFAGQVTDWEVWNEPNAWTSTDGQGHFFGSSYLYPSNYAWLLERSYLAIKSAEPTSRVLFGGLFAHESFGAQMTELVNGKPQRVTKRGDMPGAHTPAPRGKALTVRPATTCASNTPAGSDSGASYLCATYNVGLGYANWSPGGYPFDDIGQHLYLGLGTSISSSTISQYTDDLHQAYLAYEGAGTQKETFVTEVGWPTDQVSAQMQSDNLRVAFQTLRSTSYVLRSFWFNTQDAPEAGLYYGLIDTNGAAKPALSAYQQYATYASTPLPPPPTPTPTPTPTATLVPSPTPTAPAPVPPSPPAMTSLPQPQRLLDTRTNGGPIQTNSSRCFTVAGVDAVPADAVGVLLNVTAVGYSVPGWLTVYPNGQAVPTTSTLNFDGNEYAMANGSVIRVGSGGQVCVAVGTVGSAPGSSHVILDATGYLTSSALAEMPLLSAPQRLVDTRTTGGALSTGTSRCFTLAGVDGIPSNASAVLLNVAAVEYGTRGWLTLYPSGQPVPATSTLNFDPSAYAVANGTLMPLGNGGQVCVAVGTVDSAPGSSQVVLDATGYVSSTGMGQLSMLSAPQRAVDTRTSGGAIATGTSRCFVLGGQDGIPTNATGVLVNVTSVGYGARGWLSLYPQGQPVPATSTLNFDPSEYAMANNAITALASGGSVCVSVGTVDAAPGSSQAILDVVGYISP